MQDFKSKMRTVSRRVTHLRSRIDDQGVSEKAAAYDKSEVAALEGLLRVAAVYNDARGPSGSHVENTLYMVRDVIGDTLATCSGNLDADSQQRLKSAWTKANESIQVIRKLAEDAEKDP